MLKFKMKLQNLTVFLTINGFMQNVPIVFCFDFGIFTLTRIETKKSSFVYTAKH